MKGRRLSTLGFFLVACVVATGFRRPQRCSRTEGDRRGHSPRPAVSLTSAGGNIKHVIYIQFDNTHFRRDNPQVPSDLEQMPHLLNFIRDNGTLFTNDHTVLISHTAGKGSSLFADRRLTPIDMGQTVSNKLRAHIEHWRIFVPEYRSAIGPIPVRRRKNSADKVPNQTQNDHRHNGDNAPAPWVPYTRAGCDVGANRHCEHRARKHRNWLDGASPRRSGIPLTATQAEADAARALPNTPANAKAKAKPQTDFVGFALHCAQGSALCASGGTHDVAVKAEPNGYSGFKGLFGARRTEVPFKPGSQRIHRSTDLLGNPKIVDPIQAQVFLALTACWRRPPLAYVAVMQEKGRPGDLCVHLGCARFPRCRRKPACRFRPWRCWLRAAAEGL